MSQEELRPSGTEHNPNFRLEEEMAAHLREHHQINAVTTQELINAMYDCTDEESVDPMPGQSAKEESMLAEIDYEAYLNGLSEPERSFHRAAEDAFNNFGCSVPDAEADCDFFVELSKAVSEGLDVALAYYGVGISEQGMAYMGVVTPMYMEVIQKYRASYPDEVDAFIRELTIALFSALYMYEDEQLGGATASDEEWPTSAA